MKSRRSARGQDADDSGLSLVEVLVAMMIFAIIALGVAFGIVNSLVMTKESRSREVAINLASQEIDLDRSVNDIFGVLNAPAWDKVINGTTFHVARTSSWVSEDDSTMVCGSGGGSLQYKRVSVRVTWDGQSAATAPVVVDTLIAPNSRINDPALGTIIVSIKSASGAGIPGVTVTVTPSAVVPNTAAALAVPTLALTDEQGCSFALKVVPGTYDVKVAKSDFVDIKQIVSPVVMLGVAAGSAASAPFDFDNGAIFNLRYASNYTGGSSTLPTNLDTTFISTLGGVTTKQLGGVTTTRLFPFVDGYKTLVGAYVAPVAALPSCINVDPAAWTVPAADGAVGRTQPTVAGAPGASASADLPMGVIKIASLTVNNFVTAVRQSPVAGSGDPGCGIPATYQFPKLTSTTTTIALPFGSWKLYTGTAAGSLTTVITPTAPNTNVQTRNLISGTVVTLDPRLVGP
ncbi:type IV pilus modification PilV family protein [Cryobacterium sp. AP23]